MVESNENDSDMFSEVYTLLDQLSNNSKEVISIEDKDKAKIESIIVQRTNELSLAVQIAQALLVKHENDIDNICELKEKVENLKEQQTEYKSLLSQTMDSLERTTKKVDVLTEEKNALTKKMTITQVQSEVAEQNNVELKEKNKELMSKLTETETKLTKAENENKHILAELEMTTKQLKETKESEALKISENNSLKTKYENLESTYNEYYNSTQEELLEIYEKSNNKKKGEDVETLILEERSEISKARSEGGGASTDGEPKIETLMQIIEQVSKENAKLKEDYVEVDELLTEARNEIDNLKEAAMGEQIPNTTTISTQSISQEMESMKLDEHKEPETKSIEIQTDAPPKSNEKKYQSKGSQCNIINIIYKKKKDHTVNPIPTYIGHIPGYSKTSSNVSESGSTYSGSSHGGSRLKHKEQKNKIYKTGAHDKNDYYYLSPADTRFNSSYAVDGKPRWQLWKLK